MTTTETVQIQMPQMGESVTEGTVLQWHKQEGEFVDEGETVVEVSTDKVDAETPAPASGTISKVLKAEDETVEVGAALAELDPSGAPSGNGASGEAPAEDSAPPAEDPAAPGREAEDAATPDAEQAAEGEVVELRMPEMGESVTEGTVLEWHKQEGDAVAEGETVVEISTDKVDAQVPAPASGTVARRIAADRGIDLGRIRGTGIGGRITKADVLAAADGDGAAAPAAARAEATPLRGPAAMLVKAMEESRAIPTATSFRTLAVDTLDAKRKALNGELKERGMKVSFTHLVAWAMVQAATEWQMMTRSFAEADGKPQVVEPTHVNLGIAVDVERRGG